MSDLSPAAQAVLNRTAETIWQAYDAAAGDGVRAGAERRGLAAALRAAVKQTQFRQYRNCFICDAAELLAIAAELDSTPITPLEENLDG